MSPERTIAPLVDPSHAGSGHGTPELVMGGNMSRVLDGKVAIVTGASRGTDKFCDSLETTH